MDLPLILDIAIGLIFIYLILSLLASEVQELITTLFQWRAEHLKKSIEVLFSGNNSDDPTVQHFTNKLYGSPLLRSLNQQAKGVLALGFRKISDLCNSFSRFATGSRNVFNSHATGPSYIPAETFSAALLQQLDLQKVSQRISELTLKSFGKEKLNLIQEILDSLRNSLGDSSLLENEFRGLKRYLGEIIEDVVRRRLSLADGIEQISQQLSHFVDHTEVLLADNHHCKAIIRGRLPYLRQAIQLKKLEPTIAEVVSVLLTTADGSNLSPEAAEFVSSIKRNIPELPDQLRGSLVSLAEQAQMKTQGLEAGTRQLEREVEAWFNRSMDRAAGVYARNAKGVAILIGFLIAIAANADTFHMIDRLSRDSILRSTITQSANQVTARGPGVAPEAPATVELTPPSQAEIQAELTAVRNAVNTVLDELPLPIGWNAINLQQQAAAERGWGIPLLRRMLGWLISGIALSMGASFWYDILNKVMRVRNTGKPTGTSDRPRE